MTMGRGQLPTPPDVQAQVVSASYAAKDPDLQAAKPTKGGQHTPVQFFGDCSKGWCVRLELWVAWRCREGRYMLLLLLRMMLPCRPGTAAAASPQGVAGS